ncbi:RNA polymerase factor sigma-54 [Vagococcus humatus]|uniref:RNA polymerase sigma-54 factor n=1 Tax=Vagococcus humatus TaxID=1889241 RepID=A0A3R9YFW3_9ENTE|nr:RNA polymerase factor sigma-54 [Vagococcus humatus]RST90194.1 RNA polymerase sigma-54 factor [Vagococcus humatus]
MKFEQKIQMQLKQQQKLALTQELQQSIQMLQYNGEELNRFLESKALENPLLDVSITTEEAFPMQKSYHNSGDSDEERNIYNQIPDTAHSLFEYILEQVYLNYRDTWLRQLVVYLTEHLDTNGYLPLSLEQAKEETGATLIEMLDALTLLQQLDPPGIGARDLRECLMLQIERDDTAPELAYVVLEEYFQDFVDRNWDKIAKAYQVNLATIQHIADYIQTLQPFPGAGYAGDVDSYIYPDLQVEKEEEQLIVKTTRYIQPKVVFQAAYFKKMEQVEDPDVKKYLAEKKAEYEWIKHSLFQRGNTILNVGKAIVARQRSFFLETTRPLVPMTQKEIAEELGLHESTISRTVNGKYLETSFGVFELKTFFTQGIANHNGENSLSNEMVKRIIQQMIQKENKEKPLSDQKISNQLKEEQGIKLSRRTVAKYREELGIASSAKRKRYD